MCVIIHRQPNVEIPFSMLESACTVNADGMGLVSYDRGKIEVRKFFSPKGNDAETLQKFLEDAKDLHVYAHLRFRTKGATDKDNVHPFGVLKSKVHGMDVQFMHNGTLSDFGTKEACDSKHFVKSFLTPLSEKLLKAVTPDVLIHDKVYLEILNKYAGRSSVFLLADSYGNHQIVNYDNGKEYEGWWASNEYSFNSRYREPAPKVRSYPNYSEGSYYNNSPKNWNSDEFWERDGVQTTKKVISLPKTPAPADDKGSTRPPFDDNPDVATAKKEVTKGVADKAPVPPTLPKRERFIDVAKIDDLGEICALSMEQVKDLVDDYPEEAVLLIRDLIKELYDFDLAAAAEERDAA